MKYIEIYFRFQSLSPTSMVEGRDWKHMDFARPMRVAPEIDRKYSLMLFYWKSLQEWLLLCIRV